MPSSNEVKGEKKPPVYQSGTGTQMRVWSRPSSAWLSVAPGAEVPSGSRVLPSPMSLECGENALQLGSLLRKPPAPRGLGFEISSTCSAWETPGDACSGSQRKATGAGAAVWLGRSPRCPQEDREKPHRTALCSAPAETGMEEKETEKGGCLCGGGALLGSTASKGFSICCVL